MPGGKILSWEIGAKVFIYRQLALAVLQEGGFHDQSWKFWSKEEGRQNKSPCEQLSGSYCPLWLTSECLAHIQTNDDLKAQEEKAVK